MAAFIPAAGQVAGAAIGSYGNKQAAKAQERSNAAALDFAKQQQAQRQANYTGADKQYTQRLNDWQQARQALLQRYGVDISLGGPVSGATPAPSPGTAVPRTIGGIMQAQPTGQPQPAAAPADLQSWNDWSRYGLGGPRQQA